MKTITMLFLVSLMGLTACNEGPAERLGSDIDEAADDAADALDDACEDIRDAVGARDPNC